MEYRTLGSTGTIVSALCLGTMTFGNESDEEASHAQLDRFVERGGNFVDTADVYSPRRLRGDHRPLAGGPARACATGRHRDQGPLPDGRRAQRRRPDAGPT